MTIKNTDGLAGFYLEEAKCMYCGPKCAQKISIQVAMVWDLLEESYMPYNDDVAYPQVCHICKLPKVRKKLDDNFSTILFLLCHQHAQISTSEQASGNRGSMQAPK